MAGISIEPILAHPTRAEPGRRYVFTVDLRLAAGAEWPDPKREEVVFYCIPDAWPLFECASGSEPVVLHRFGGSYGPARFVFTAVQGENSGRVSFTLTSDSGVPLTVLETDEISIRRGQSNDSDTDEPIRVFDTSRGRIQSLVILKDLNEVVSCAENRIISTDLETGETRWTREVSGTVMGLAGIHGREIIHAHDGELEIYDAADQQRRTIASFKSPITCFAVTEDQSTAAVALADGTILLTGISDDKNHTASERTISFRAGGLPLVSIAISSNVDVVGAHEDHTLFFWLGRGARETPFESLVRCVFRAGSQFYLGCDDGSVAFLIASESRLRGSPTPVTAVALRSSSEDRRLSLVFAGHENGAIDIYDLDYSCLLSTIHAHVSGVTALACTDEEIISGSANGSIRVWEIPSYSPLELYHRRLANAEQRKFALSEFLSSMIPVSSEPFSGDKLELYLKEGSNPVVGVCADESRLAEFEMYSTVLLTNYREFTWLRRSSAGHLQGTEQFILDATLSEQQEGAFRAFLESGIQPQLRDRSGNVAFILQERSELNLTLRLFSWLTSAGGFEPHQILLSDSLDSVHVGVRRAAGEGPKTTAFLFLCFHPDSIERVRELLGEVVRAGYRRLIVLCEIRGEAVYSLDFQGDIAGLIASQGTEILCAWASKWHSGQRSGMMAAFLDVVHQSGQSAKSLVDALADLTGRVDHFDITDDFPISVVRADGRVHLRLRLPWEVSRLEITGKNAPTINVLRENSVVELDLPAGSYTLSASPNRLRQDLQVTAHEREFYVFPSEFAMPYRVGVLCDDADMHWAVTLNSKPARSHPKLSLARIRFETRWHDELLRADALLVILNRAFQSSEHFQKLLRATEKHPDLPVLLVRSEEVATLKGILSVFALDGVPLNKLRSDQAAEQMAKELDEFLHNALQVGWYHRMDGAKKQVFRIRGRGRSVIANAFAVSPTKLITLHYPKYDSQVFQADLPEGGSIRFESEAVLEGVQLLRSELPVTRRSLLAVRSRPPEIGERVMLVACLDSSTAPTLVPGEIAAVEKGTFSVCFAGEVSPASGGAPLLAEDGSVLGVEYQAVSALPGFHHAIRADGLAGWLDEHGIGGRPRILLRTLPISLEAKARSAIRGVLKQSSITPEPDGGIDAAVLLIAEKTSNRVLKQEITLIERSTAKFRIAVTRHSDEPVRALSARQGWTVAPDAEWPQFLAKLFSESA